MSARATSRSAGAAAAKAGWPLRGVLWYQGESNAERASEYHALFSAMITAWRGHFGQGDPSTGSGQVFPFYWVSLANYAVPVDGGEKGRTYALLREAQAKSLVSVQSQGSAKADDRRIAHACAGCNGRQGAAQHPSWSGEDHIGDLGFRRREGRSKQPDAS